MCSCIEGLYYKARNWAWSDYRELVSSNLRGQISTWEMTRSNNSMVRVYVPVKRSICDA